MNITPLIDVMLVLLVMLIITLPMTLHQVPVDLPAGPAPVISKKPVTQRLALSNSGITTWNGVALSDDALAEKLRAAAIAQDDVQFQTEANARYERFDQLIALVKRNGVIKIGFVGNSGFAKYD
jgi:biopolymer transport protein ExbD